MIGYKKEEGIAFIVLGPFSFEIARRQQEEIDCISEKAKSLPGFESGSLRQNAIALSLLSPLLLKLVNLIKHYFFQ